MNDEGIEITYHDSQRKGPYQWRFKINFTDGSSIRIFADVKDWTWFPLNEVIERVTEFHGIADEHIIGMQFNRYTNGVRVY
jgi:hypothetical protein